MNEETHQTTDIVITRTTCILAAITLILNGINNVIVGWWVLDILSTAPDGDINTLEAADAWITDFELFVGLPVMVLTSVFPVFWIVQNRSKRWIWVAG